MIDVDGHKFLELVTMKTDGETSEYPTLIAVAKIDCVNSVEGGSLLYLNGSDIPAAVREGIEDIRKQLTNQIF